MKKHSIYLNQILLFLVLAFYIFVLLKILLFKYISPFELFNANRLFSRTMNVIPVKSILNYFFNAHFSIKVAFMNVIGNIIIFIPMGIYIQVFKKSKDVLKSVIIVCFISFSVEITQYIFGIGGTDIDDIILNTIGGLLGIIIYKILASFLKSENKTKTVITFLSLLAGIFCIIYSINFYPQLLALPINNKIITLGDELGANDKSPDIMGDFIKINGNVLTVKNIIGEYGDKYDSKYEDGETDVLIAPNTQIIMKIINFNYGSNQMLLSYESITFEQLKSLTTMIDTISCLHVIEENGNLIAKDMYVFHEVK